MIHAASWCTFAAAAHTSACKEALKKTGDKASHGHKKNTRIKWLPRHEKVLGEKWGSRTTVVFDGIRFKLIRSLFAHRTCSKYEVQRTGELHLHNSKLVFSPKTRCPCEPFGFYCRFQHLSWLWRDMIKTKKTSRTMQNKSWTCTSKQLHCTP